MDGSNFSEQLRMFIPAGEIHDKFEHGDLMPDETLHGLYDLKRYENDKYGFNQTLDAEGIQQPIDVWHHDDSPPVLSNGHHRVTWAYDKDPRTEVPIKNSFSRSIVRRHK